MIQGLLSPDFYLLGEHDQRSGDLLEGIYRQQADPPVRVARMNIVNAELTKIAINTFITAKFSFASTLAQICSKLPDGNARASTYLYNTLGEIDMLLGAVENIAKGQ